MILTDDCHRQYHTCCEVTIQWRHACNEPVTSAKLKIKNVNLVKVIAIDEREERGVTLRQQSGRGMTFHRAHSQDLRNLKTPGA